MNAFRVLFLTAIFAFSMIFLFQNTQVLDNRLSLVLDLWWTQLSSPEIALYLFIFLCLLAGIIFGALTFFPGNKELRRSLKTLKLKIKSLTREIIDMQKKEEVLEDKSQEKTDHPQEPPIEEDRDLKEQPAAEGAAVKPAGAAGRIALAGVLALFVILTGFYFFVDQRLEQIQTSLDDSIQSSVLAVAIAERVDQETAGFREDIEDLSTALDSHAQDIAELQRLPQDTMDYLTMMLINEYTVKIQQLLKSAETAKDRSVLAEALDSLEKALSHYMNKVD